MAVEHQVSADGESMEKWALYSPDFRGTIKQLLNCGRCGEPLPFKRHDEPRHVRDMFKPTMHVICDECYNQLPEIPTKDTPNA